ncbi:CARDB domain-containing protein [Rubrivirga sp.]|uniref:CARDB domain-containing protein n=1 Tax=Rubrivirga sp. TaxID=1885344 RepID=UPI003B526F07
MRLPFAFALLAALAAPVVAQPDLTVSGSVEASDQGVEPGEDVSVDYTVFNSGTGEVEPLVGFYLSDDEVLDSADTFLGADEAGEVGPGESEDDSEDVDIPSDTAEGQYFLLFVVDYNGAISETDETNNVDAAALTVGDGGAGGADLVVSAALSDDDDDEDDDLQPDAGEDVDIDYTVSNVGSASAGDFVLRVTFSTDTTPDDSDEVLTNVDIDGLDAGDNTDDTVTVTIPEGTPAGTYYVLFQADAGGEVAETDETNNTAAVEIEVTGGDDGTVAIGEVGTFNWPEQEPDTFYPVFLSRSYTNPVVVAPSFSSAQEDVPAVPRVQAITADQFEIQLAEWPYLDGTHLDLDIPYLVVEAGAHTLDDGRRVEAGFVTANGNGVGRIDFSEAFPGTPVVFAQPVGGDAVVTARLRVREDRAQVRLVQQEAGGADLGPTTVAWVAIEAGLGDGERPVVAKRIRADSELTRTRFGAVVSTSAVMLAATQSVSEDDPVTVRVLLSGRIGGRLVLQEERSADAETSHAPELVGYAVFEPGTLRASSAAASASTASVAAAVTAAEAPLGVYPNPLRDRATVAFDLPAADRVRLDVFDVTGRLVARLAAGALTEGRHDVAVDASAWPSGVYVYRLVSESGAVSSGTMTVVR